MHTLNNGSPIVIREPRREDALAWHTFIAEQRAATYGDILRADFVEHSLAQFAEHAEERRAEFEHPGTSVRRIAVADDRIVGAAEVRDGPSPWELSRDVVEISASRKLAGLYLLEEARGNGLATTLMDLVIGDDEVYLWILNMNTRAHRFYLKNGFFDLDEESTTGEAWGNVPNHRMVRPSRLDKHVN